MWLLFSFKLTFIESPEEKYRFSTTHKFNLTEENRGKSDFF